MTYADAAFPLAILAKAPIPGQAKTRLIPQLGAEGAAELHRQLVWQTLETAVATTPPASITLWTSLAHPGSPEYAFFETCREHFGIRLCEQPTGDLGRRMYAALAAMPSPGLVIGSDCPVLTPDLLKRCHVALETAECVFLPAEDGGYALVGVRRANRQIFEGVSWGSARVMQQTREHIDALGWRCACPAVVWDIDRPEDLARWQAWHQDSN
jgi:rSAM/selenodomain-associated transferase 1